MKEWWALAPLCLYLAAVIGSLLIARKLRPTRWPFKDEDRLLRGPGESLRKEILRIDEAMLAEMAGGIVVALLVIPVAVSLAKYLGAGGAYQITIAAVAFLAATIISTRRILGLWQRRQTHHLGWFGERLVAEKLAPLRFSGWRVFHDVPFVSDGRHFNIDHVVVGEGGLFAIETKTRRKGGAREGQIDYEVEFDGQALHWPRQKNDESGLLQAERNARTLTAWLEKEIGQRVPAIPLLVIPGWSIKLTGKLGRRPCRVDSANWVQNTFRDRTPCISRQTLELIVLRLLAKCRDVED